MKKKKEKSLETHPLQSQEEVAVKETKKLFSYILLHNEENTQMTHTTRCAEHTDLIKENLHIGISVYVVTDTHGMHAPMVLKLRKLSIYFF